MSASCASEETLLELIEGRLSPEAFEGVEQHLSQCETCRELVAVATPATSPEPAGGNESFVSGGQPKVGRYEILSPIGAGGMGVVYAAHDPQLDRKVALKMLRPSGLPGVSPQQLRARILREGRAMALLSHPNVLAVYDVGEFQDQVFVAMELAEGGTVASWLRERPRSWREVLDVFLAAGRGLAAAHAKALVHRDFKPENILFGGDGRVLVTDFGVAQLTAVPGSEPLTAGTPEAGGPTASLCSSALVGSPAYMAPEQMRGEQADVRADLFSFCVSLYEALYGQRPFAGETVADLQRAMNESEVRRPPGGTRVPAWIRRALLRGLRAEPRERPQKMEALLTLLSRPGRQWRAPLVFYVGLLLATTAWLALRTRIGKQNADTERSIAVLPFASLSTGEENGYVAQGFHDELLRQLGRIGDLRVISRTSVMQYKEGARNSREIAEALGVSSIVEGSVQQAGNRVRVEARLIDARNDRQIWGDRYDRDVTDVFGIQTAVAQEIARTLQARISPAQKAQIERKPTESAAAYDLYLRALEYANRPGPQPDNLEIAERLYRQAIQADPAFALARAGLASVRMYTYWFIAGAPDSVAEEAKQEAEHALRLQPDLPEGHLALGYYHYYGRLDYDRALKEFEVARSGVPAEAVNAIGFVLRRQGKYDEAIRYQQEAFHFDPSSPRTRFELAFSFTYTRRYEEADGVLDQVLTIAPDFTAASMAKAFVQEAWKGEMSLAKKVIREARGRLDPQGRVGQQGWIIGLLRNNPREALPFLDSLDSDSIIGSRGGAGAVFPKAFLYAVAHEGLGEADQARKEYETALPLLAAEVEKNPGRPFQRSLLAHTYAGLGRKEDALREARRAVEILPISKDQPRGTEMEIERAAVEARVGELDAAIEHIRHLLSIPCLLSPGLLRIDPHWAPLREDPRFRKLAELERE